jgi:hypothetical protein
MNRSREARDRRRKVALENQADRDKLTDQQQLEVIEKRRGESSREKGRLLARISKNSNKKSKKEELFEADNVDDLMDQLNDKKPKKPYKKGKRTN